MHLSGFVGVGMAMLALGAPLATAQTQDDFFDDSFVHELRMQIKASDWNLLRQNYLENTYYPVVFHWIYKGKDIIFDNVGIRSRGHGSRSPVKPNLRVDFNRYAPGQTFLGLTSFILKANNQDPSMLKERSVFKLWDRTGLPASREAFTRLYVNDVYYGVFLVTEELRTEYEQRYLGESGGDLFEWKPITETYHFEWNATCPKSDSVACSTDPNKWNPIPFNPEENKATFDLAPTINMIRTLNQVSDADFESTASTFFDLKLWAFHNGIENYVADFDSILGDVYGMNNFWLYRYKNSNFHQFLLWDKDASYDWSHRPIFEQTDKNVFMRRTLALPNRRAQYLESLYKVAVLAGGPGGWLEWELNREYGLAGPSIREDPFKQYEVGGIVQNSSNDVFEAQVVTDNKFVVERNPFVLQEVFAAGLAPSTSVSVTAAVNAATFTGSIAPGAYAALGGSGLATQTVSADPGVLPLTLGGVSVFVNGFQAPLLFVSPGQINLQVPWELGPGDGTAPFTVMVNGPTAKGTRAGSPVNGTFSNTVKASVDTYSPGVFGIAQNDDGSPLTSRPAKAGDILLIFANGLGPVNGPVTTGGISPGGATCQKNPLVTIGGLQAEVLFAGLAPGYVGAYQVNIRVPAGLPAGSAPLVITAGSRSMPAYNLPTQ